MNIQPILEDGTTPNLVVEKRKEPRTACHGEVEIMTLGFLQRVLSGTLHNLSPSGFCILLKRHLATGTNITTVIDEELIFGCVLHTVASTEGFLTGIQIKYAVRRSDAA